MPNRLILYDAFLMLDRGCDLIEIIGSPLGGIYRYSLEGVPEVYIVFDRLRDEGWIEVRKAHSHLVAYQITPKGREIFEEGKVWYSGLKWWQKFLGRLGLPVLPK